MTTQTFNRHNRKKGSRDTSFEPDSEFIAEATDDFFDRGGVITHKVASSENMEEFIKKPDARAIEDWFNS